MVVRDLLASDYVQNVRSFNVCRRSICLRKMFLT